MATAPTGTLGAGPAPAESTWTPAAATKSTSTGGDNGTGGLTWVAGDIVVVMALAADGGTTFGALPSTAGSNMGAFSSLGNVGQTGVNCRGAAWTATATGSGNGVIALTSSNSDPYGLIAWRIDGASTDGLGTISIPTPTTAIVLSYATTTDNSAALMVIGDWGAVAVTSAAYVPTGQTVREATDQGNTYSNFALDWADRGVAGTTNYGLSTSGGYSASGSPYTKVVLEVKGKAGAAVPGDAGPQTVPMFLPLLTYDPLMQGAVYPMRPWQRRFQWATQPWLNSDAVVSGGTTTPISLGGTLAPAGALVNQDQKPLAGATAPAGALARQAQKPLAGSITPTGALAKRIVRTLAGSVTPAGALTVTKVILKSFGGALTPAGSLVKQIGKALAGATTPAGVLTKQDQRILAGSTTPVGVLTTVKVILKTFTGSLTPTGALINQARKPLAGAVTPAGALIKQDRKTLTGSATPAGVVSLTKVLLRSFAGTIGPAGTATLRTGKTLAGASSPSGAMSKQDRKTFTAATTPAGALTVGKSIVRAFAGTLAPSGGLTRRTGKALAGSTAPSGGVVKRTARTLLAALTPAGAATVQAGIQFTVGALTATSAQTSVLTTTSQSTAALTASSSRAGPS